LRSSEKLQSRLLRVVVSDAGELAVERGWLPKVFVLPGAVQAVFIDHAALLRRVKTWVPAPSFLPHWRRFKELAGSAPALRHCLEPFRQAIVLRSEAVPPSSRGVRERRRASSSRNRSAAGTFETSDSVTEYSMGSPPRRAEETPKRPGRAGGPGVLAEAFLTILRPRPRRLDRPTAPCFPKAFRDRQAGG
jgi:hypothetical protein